MPDFRKHIFESLNALYHVAPTDLLYWRGTYPDYDPTDLPEPGSEISMGEGYEYNQYAAKDSIPDLIRVPGTGYGDYGGSSVDRSNCEALFEDFPQFFIKTNGGYDSHELLFPTYWQPTEGTSDEDALAELDNVLDIIKGMHDDYPLYDEEHHSNLEVEAATEAWSQWVYYDIKNMLRHDHGVDDDVLDAFEETGEDPLQRLFWEIDCLQNSSPYLEDAVNVVFPYLDSEVAAMVPTVVREGYRYLLRQAKGNHGQVKHLRDQRKAALRQQ